MAVALYEPPQEASSFLHEVRSALQDFAQHFRGDCQLLSPRELAETTTAVEELSKTVEQLQISAAHALDQQKVATTGESDHRFSWADPASPASGGGEPGKRTEFRDTADYLRERLKISRSEARRRLRLGESTQPATLITGEQAPPKLPMLGAALAGSQISGRAATLIRDAVERVRPSAGAEDLQAMEQMLTRQAAEADTDILVEVIKRWEAGLDPDGKEPSDEFLRARQGVFIRGQRNGLHQIEIAATDEQYEYLVSVMNTSTNPRLGRTFAPEDGSEAVGQAAAVDADGAVRPAPAEPTRAQKLLNGLVDACRMALAADKLPATGGHRPQVMVTIDYEELKKQVGGTGLAVFGGLISAGTVRRIACDADLIPVVLGGRGEVLDVGRAQRLFTPAMRRALVARDGGCAFPGCTIPAPWTEAHHIIWWEHSGTTSTDNGCLLCSFHHHLIHQGHWQVESRGGIPWFIPPPWTDPEQKPLRNRYRQACATQPDESPPGAGP